MAGIARQELLGKIPSSAHTSNGPQILQPKQIVKA